MGVPSSPARAVAPSTCPDLEMREQVTSKTATKQLQAWPLTNWFDAQHLTLLICGFAGGLPMARHLASASRAFHKGVSQTWEGLIRCFPCRIYVVGGLDKDYRPVSTAERFDPRTGSWESLPQLKIPRAGPCAMVASGRLYILGGEFEGEALSDAQRFDPSLSRWEMLPAMHVGRIRAGAVFCGRYLYVFGGLDGSRPLCSAERYDPSSRKWELLPPMHCPRYACVAAVHAHRIFVFGGNISDGAMTSSIECYDPETRRWEMLSAVQAPCCGAAVAIVDEGRAAFSVGGLGLSGQALGISKRLSLDSILMSSNDNTRPNFAPSWGPLPPMPTPRHLVSLANFYGGAVAVGGKGAGFEASRSVELFNPDAWAWEELAPLPNPRIRAAVVSGRL